eukprot:4855985-Prymnesium_polylepis.2
MSELRAEQRPCATDQLGVNVDAEHAVRAVSARDARSELPGVAADVKAILAAEELGAKRTHSRLGPARRPLVALDVPVAVVRVIVAVDELWARWPRRQCSGLGDLWLVGWRARTRVGPGAGRCRRRDGGSSRCGDSRCGLAAVVWIAGEPCVAGARRAGGGVRVAGGRGRRGLRNDRWRGIAVRFRRLLCSLLCGLLCSLLRVAPRTVCRAHQLAVTTRDVLATDRKTGGAQQPRLHQH